MHGRKSETVFRYRSLDPEERAIPTDKPLLLSANDDKTESSGFYRVAYAASAAPEKVVMLDKSFGAIVKAKNADRVVFTQARFDEFPDLWVSDLTFRDIKKVSNANPQQAEYNWGKAELMQYINADGKTLRAILIKPENFDPSKKYPMMVYIYEELSEGLHSYRAPNPGTSINITRYVSNGYLVLMPDIVYDTGYPGESAEKCVIPAVNTVVAQGFVDPKRIGIQGHSWGGYQITHLITQTNLFAAVQAGASVSNMISAYGGIRWGTGMSRAFQYEKTQSRIGAPPWDAPLQFIENSPIFWVEKVQTPFLMIHNDEDDAVPWYQGIEFFSAMRRLGKEAYLFNYNGEAHGLRQRDNQKHWTVHQDEFFDHFLLGKPKPEWMEKGVPVSGARYGATSPTCSSRRSRRPSPVQRQERQLNAGRSHSSLTPDVALPQYATAGSAAFDLAAARRPHDRARRGHARADRARHRGAIGHVPRRVRAQQHAAQARPDGRQRRRRRRLGLLRSRRRDQGSGHQRHERGRCGSPSGDRIAQGILLPAPRVEWEEVGDCSRVAGRVWIDGRQRRKAGRSEVRKSVGSVVGLFDLPALRSSDVTSAGRAPARPA